MSNVTKIKNELNNGSKLTGDFNPNAPTSMREIYLEQHTSLYPSAATIGNPDWDLLCNSKNMEQTESSKSVSNKSMGFQSRRDKALASHPQIREEREISNPNTKIDVSAMKKSLNKKFSAPQMIMQFLTNTKR